MKKWYKKVVSVGLVCISIGSTFACENASSSQNNTVLPEYERTMQLEFDSWLGPKRSETAMKEYAECGYTTFHAWTSHANVGDVKLSDEELNRQMDETFTLAEKYGLKVVLAMTPVSVGSSNIHSFEYVNSRLSKTLTKWKDSDVFYGYMNTDEYSLDKPLKFNEAFCGGRDQKKQYDRAIDFLLDDYLYFSSLYSGKYYETVLLGIPDGDDKNMWYFAKPSDDFDAYLDFYYDNLIKYMPISDRVYSFDAYPFTATGDTYHFHDRFVGSLEQVAIAAEKAKAKKTTYIQNHHSIDNPMMVSYQYYTAMCYGYTHFTTYCYTNAWGEKQYSVDYNGQKTDNYYYFQDAHERVKSMEVVYTNFCNNRIGTMAFEGSKRKVGAAKSWSKAEAMLESYSSIDKCETEQDLLIGIYKDGQGNEGFMLANQMLPADNTSSAVRLSLKGAKKAAVWLDGAECQIIDLQNEKLLLTLQSGGGAFVIPIK